VFQKSDAKIQIIITMAHLIRINYSLSSYNYHISGATVANFNKIHCKVFEQQLFKQEDPLPRKAQRIRRASLVYFMTFIGRQTTDQQLINHLYKTGHETEFRAITQNNGHYNVQGRSR